jgi:hypothetical protein
MFEIASTLQTFVRTVTGFHDVPLSPPESSTIRRWKGSRPPQSKSLSVCYDPSNLYTVIPRLTNDHANGLSANEDFPAVFRTRLTNMDSANECFSGCAR